MTNLSPFSLDGRIVMVTGANTGIGQGIALAVARAGGHVLAVGRSSMEDTRKLVSLVGGKIVNVASLLSFQGGVRVASYTAAKHWVAGITRILCNEWAAKGLNVNAIAPGYIESNNTAGLRADPDRSSAILDRIPAGRWGQPSDIGDAAVFLLARASD